MYQHDHHVYDFNQSVHVLEGMPSDNYSFPSSPLFKPPILWKKKEKRAGMPIQIIKTPPLKNHNPLNHAQTPKTWMLSHLDPGHL